MAAARFTGTHCGGNLSAHLCIIVGHTGKIHNLTQTNNIRPCHRLHNLFYTQLRSSAFKTRCGGHATGHLHKNVNR